MAHTGEQKVNNLLRLLPEEIIYMLCRDYRMKYNKPPALICINLSLQAALHPRMRNIPQVTWFMPTEQQLNIIPDKEWVMLLDENLSCHISL